MSKQYPSKEEITYDEYLQIIGLLALAKEHVRMLDGIEKALERIVDDKTKSGHCPDAIFNNYSADELLERMEIKVLPASLSLHAETKE